MMGGDGESGHGDGVLCFCGAWVSEPHAECKPVDLMAALENSIEQARAVRNGDLATEDQP